jgi:hypothetical protein
VREGLISFVERMDRCWIERRFNDFRDYLDHDVVMVAPGCGDGGAGRPHRIAGSERVVESYRDFMIGSAVQRFTTSDHYVTERRPAAVVEYRWGMAWTAGSEQEATGRKILVLQKADGRWRVIWTMQLPA